MSKKLTPVWTDGKLVSFYQGDSREVLCRLPSGSVRCCVTSPPYFGLRDYGTGQWVGGDPECSHKSVQYPDPKYKSGRVVNGKPSKRYSQLLRGVCACGAVRKDKQIGLEQTPAEYVEQLVAVFREVRRVLADDGTLWLNLGDSYASTGGHTSQGSTSQRGGRSNIGVQNGRKGFAGGDGVKPKDLIGIPWRVAFALQADGWHLRQDIIWHKLNPMPESVRDRCTKAHEYLFLLSKSPRYYFDAEAIKETSVDPESHKGMRPRSADSREGDPYFATKVGNHASGKVYATRNRRSVWTITTKPYKDAHFATFPPELVEPCILAGSAEGDIVLDPFGGSGTVALSSVRNKRRAQLIELNPKYIDMSVRRVRGALERAHRWPLAGPKESQPLFDLHT